MIGLVMLKEVRAVLRDGRLAALTRNSAVIVLNAAAVGDLTPPPEPADAAEAARLRAIAEDVTQRGRTVASHLASRFANGHRGELNRTRDEPDSKSYRSARRD